jgi:hypothetical protein
MTSEARLRYLRIALLVSGTIFILGIYPLVIVWPSGWRWQPHNPNYEQMIVGIYATLGVFLLRAAKDPLKHLSLIWFTVWSSIVHGGIMLLQAIFQSHEHGHLIGDVPALFLVAVLLGWLTPRGEAARARAAVVP